MAAQQRDSQKKAGRGQEGIEVKDPENYWQARSVILENIVTSALSLISEIMPPDMQKDVEMLVDEWDKALDNIEGME